MNNVLATDAKRRSDEARGISLSSYLLQWHASQSAAQHGAEKKDNRPSIIGYQTDLAEICDRDVNQALLLSQILFLYLPSAKTGKSKLRIFRDGRHWIANSYEAWGDILVMKPNAVKYAIKKLKDAGLIETKRYRWKGSPTQHVALNQDALEAKLRQVGFNPDGSTPPMEQENFTDRTEKNSRIEQENFTDLYTETTDRDYSTETTHKVTTTQAAKAGGGDEREKEDLGNAQKTAEMVKSLLSGFDVRVAKSKTLIRECKGKKVPIAQLNAIAVAEKVMTGQVKSPQGMLTIALRENWAPSWRFVQSRLNEHGQKIWLQELFKAMDELGIMRSINIKIEMGPDDYRYTLGDGRQGTAEYTFHPFPEYELGTLWSELQSQEAA